MTDYDAIVVGAGHNGLTAAAILPCIVLMRAERRARLAKRHEQEALEIGALAEAVA